MASRLLLTQQHQNQTLAATQGSEPKVPRVPEALTLSAAAGSLLKGIGDSTGTTSSSSDLGAWGIVLGVPISVAGSTLTVIGVFVQKLSRMQEDDSTTETPQIYCFNRQWIFGITLFGIGNVMTWVSLSMAPNSVLSCFMSWNIICSLMIAPKWFENEVVSMRMWYCAAVLVIGCIWVAIAGPRSYRLETIDHLQTLFSFPAFHYATATLVAYFLFALIRYFHVQKQKNWSLLTVAQIVSLSAISAAYSVMFSKCSSSLVTSSIADAENSQVQDNGFFVLIALAAVCGVSQIHFLNEGMKHGAASFVVPFYQSLAMSIQLVVGGMLFQEYVHFTWQHHVKFWPGVVLVFLGMIALMRVAQEDEA